MATVLVRFLGDARDLQRAASEGGGALERFGGTTQNLGDRLTGLGTKMTGLVTVPIVAAMGLATRAAAEEGKEIATLTNVLQNNVGATDSQVAAVEKWITATQNATGVADGQLRPALGNLLIAGRSVEEAQKDLGVALDIAAAKGLDVETVSNAMAKAAQGNVGALGRLGIATKHASGETLSYDEVLRQASKTMGGAAAAAADTAAGRAAIFQAKMADLTEEIGSKAIPALETFVDVGGGVIDFLTGLPRPAQAGIAGLVGFTAALGPIMTVAGNVAKLTDKVKALDAASLAAKGGAIGAALAIVGIGVAASQAAESLESKALGIFREMSDLTNGELVEGFEKSGRSIDVFRGMVENNLTAAVRLRDALREAGESTEALDRILDPAIERQRDLADANTEAAAEIAGVADVLDAAERVTRDYGQSTERLNDALDRSSETLKAVRDDQDAATGSFERATGSVKDYETALWDAAEALNEALRPPSPEDAESAALGVERAYVGVGDALDAVTEAEAELDRLRRSAGTADEIREAEEALRDARFDAEEAVNRVEDAEAALEDARRNGTSEDVRRATLDLRQARVAQTEATRAEQSAERELDRLRSPASAEQIAAAERNVADARRAHRQSVLDLTEAQQRQQDVQRQGTDQDERVIDARRRVRDAEDALTQAKKEQAWWTAYLTDLQRRENDELDRRSRIIERMPRTGSADSIERQLQGGSTNLTVNISGVLAADKDQFRREVENAIVYLRRSGHPI